MVTPMVKDPDFWYAQSREPLMLSSSIPGCVTPSDETSALVSSEQAFMFARGAGPTELLLVVGSDVSVSENGPPPPLPLVVAVLVEALGSPWVSLLHATSEPVSATSTDTTKAERFTRESPIFS
jgi:hypothetical protein